jgi:hypothetical protein
VRPFYQGDGDKDEDDNRVKLFENKALQIHTNRDRDRSLSSDVINYDWIIEEGDHFYTWWTWANIDWEYVEDHMQRLNFLRTRSFMLPNDPNCNSGFKSDDVCFDVPEPNSNYYDAVDCEDCVYKDDMYVAAVSLFEAINYLRGPITDCDTFDEVWAVRECEKSFELNTWAPFTWNEALARTARYVINEEGACGTRGSAYSEYIEEALLKYYAYSYENLYFQKITSSELVNINDIYTSGWQAIEYILSQDCISNKLFEGAAVKEIGIGCACDAEEYPGE